MRNSLPTLLLLALMAVLARGLSAQIDPFAPGPPEKDEPSPLNTLAPPRNSPRLGSRIPDIYGEMRTYPDLIMPGESVWSGRSQAVRALYCVGVGEYDLAQYKVGETDLDQQPELASRVAGKHKAD